VFYVTGKVWMTRPLTEEAKTPDPIPVTLPYALHQRQALPPSGKVHKVKSQLLAEANQIPNVSTREFSRFELCFHCADKMLQRINVDLNRVPPNASWYGWVGAILSRL
jgi:hypothetical protein